MVTPFLSGLRKWISENCHLKGKLIPAEEDGLLEDAIHDEVVQNGTTDDLIAMLRRQQPPEQEVDLMGMLRNGNNTQSHSQIPLHPTNPYLPQDGMSYMFQQSGNGQQGSDLMEFSPKIEPSRHSEQLPPPPINPAGPFNPARQESLLNILKGGAPNAITEPNPSNPSLLDLLKSPQSASLAPASPPKSQHQQNLLSMLKSPQQSSTTPTIQNLPKAAPLSYVETQRTDPRSHPKSPPARPNLPSAESHQHALLATLKSNPKPPNPPQSPSSKAPPSPTLSSRQNSLLSSLKSPKLESQTDHTTSLLATLNKPPSSNYSPTPVSTTPSKTPGSNQIAASSHLAGNKSPPVLHATPTPAHQASLLSAFKNPTVPAATSTVPAPSTAHTSSLLSAFKNPPTGPSRVEKQGLGKSVEMAPGEVKNVHMESLLKTLKSPSASPVMEKIRPSEMTSEVPSAQTNGPRIATAIPMVKDTKEESETPKVGRVATGSDHVNSLLSALKGPNGLVGSGSPPVTYSPIDKSNKSIVTNDKKHTPTVPEPNSSTKPSFLRPTTSPATVVKNPTTTVNSLLDTLKGKSTAPASPPTPPTAHQKSLLSVLNPPSPRTQSPPSKPSPKAQQFNFSPTPQVGKRIKFRETLVPGGGIKEFQPERKTNGTGIDLGKVILLKHGTPEPPASSREVVREGTEIEDEAAKQTETGEVKGVREESPQPNQSSTGKEDSVSAREITPEPRLSLPSTAQLSQSDTENARTIHAETGDITVLKRPEPSKTESAPLESKLESPLGIEFPFRRRTPTKSSRGSPTPTTTPTRSNSQSLLAFLKGPPPEVQKEENVGPEDSDVISPLGSVKAEPSEAIEESIHWEETVSRESLGTEREMKLIAMLERALARGVPS